MTGAHITVSGYHAADHPHRLLLAGGDTVRLHAEPRLTLHVTEEYQVSQDSAGWRVNVLGYLYGIEYEGRGLVAYHRHPHGASPITTPPLHVGADVKVGDRWLGKIHLPTGTVALEQVLALAIAELSARAWATEVVSTWFAWAIAILTGLADAASSVFPHFDVPPPVPIVGYAAAFIAANVWAFHKMRIRRSARARLRRSR